MPTSSIGQRDRETRAHASTTHKMSKRRRARPQTHLFHWHAAAQQFTQIRSVRVGKTFTVELARPRPASFPTKTSSLHLCMRQLICSIEFCYLSEMFNLKVLRMRSNNTVATSDTTNFCFERFKCLLNARESSYRRRVAHYLCS